MSKTPLYMKLGYTEKQAARIIDRIDRTEAKIEDALMDLKSIVTDGPSVYTADIADQLHEVCAKLRETVERRKREEA